MCIVLPCSCHGYLIIAFSTLSSQNNSLALIIIIFVVYQHCHKISFERYFLTYFFIILYFKIPNMEL